MQAEGHRKVSWVGVGGKQDTRHMCYYPTNIASANLGCSKVSSLYCNPCPAVLMLYKRYISDMEALEQPKCRPLPSLTTTSVATEGECAPTSDTSVGWVVEILTRHIGPTLIEHQCIWAYVAFFCKLVLRFGSFKDQAESFARTT